MRALKIWGMTMVVVIAVLGLYIYQNNREYQIILLNTNDSHGSILPVDSVGGMAERATFIRMVREKNPYRASYFEQGGCKARYLGLQLHGI